MHMQSCMCMQSCVRVQCGCLCAMCMLVVHISTHVDIHMQRSWSDIEGVGRGWSWCDIEGVGRGWFWSDIEGGGFVGRGWFWCDIEGVGRGWSWSDI